MSAKGRGAEVDLEVCYTAGGENSGKMPSFEAPGDGKGGVQPTSPPPQGWE